MSKSQVKIDIEESTIEEDEPTIEEVERQAVKQLILELNMIRSRVRDSGTVMNSMLVVQIKQLLRGLMSKYQTFGLLQGENVELKLNGLSKHATFDFKYTPRLNELINEVLSSLPKPGVEPIEPKEVA